jgi:hypothetical protein
MSCRIEFLTRAPKFFSVPLAMFQKAHWFLFSCGLCYLYSNSPICRVVSFFVPARGFSIPVMFETKLCLVFACFGTDTLCERIYVAYYTSNFVVICTWVFRCVCTGQVS